MIRKKSLIVLISIVCVGCGVSQREELAERTKALKAEYDIAIGTCVDAHKKSDPRAAVARAQCLNEASDKFMRPVTPNPDLLDLLNATRLAIAEKYAKGQISEAEAEQQFYLAKSQVVTESQKRMLANRSVKAQEISAAAAIAATGPVTCNRFGNTVNCF